MDPLVHGIFLVGKSLNNNLIKRVILWYNQSMNKIVVANWKMNPSSQKEAEVLFKESYSRFSKSIFSLVSFDVAIVIVKLALPCSLSIANSLLNVNMA